MGSALSSVPQNDRRHDVRSELPKVERQGIVQTGDSLQVQYFHRPQKPQFRCRSRSVASSKSPLFPRHTVLACNRITVCDRYLL